MNLKRFMVLMFTLLVAALLLAPQMMMAQTTTTGDVTGTVTDPAGAVISGATVTLKNGATGTSQTTTTNDKGFYRFSLLNPGDYTLVVSASGFKDTSRPVSVSIGRVNDQDFKMSITATTVEVVTGEVPLLQTEEANVATSYNESQVRLVPNPGNDLSYVAQTAPGAVMNTQSGFGNFSTFGLPATSNLFTLDGMNDNDPFLNLNNSGATNLLLGQNEIAEVSVVNNGYSGQYGQLAGSTVNYVTKSGTNKFHGNAIWWWNGRVMNANDWFNNHTIDQTTGKGTPRPFDNANQYALSFGGPIQKDKTFFFVDYEGLRVLLPTSNPATIPSPQFEAATIAQLNASGLTASVPFYQNMFNLYNNAAGAAGASPKSGPDGCSGASGADFPTDTNLGVSEPCTLTFRSTASNFTHEWLLGVRIDHIFSEKDRLFGRFQTDHGVQATFTDPISPVFNGVSTQPEYQGQLSETHIFSGRTANSLVISGQWYSAIFEPPSLSAAIAAFPSNMFMNDNSLTPLGGIDTIFPQGRNVTGYQIVDDISHTHGNHTFKFGVNYHRNDVTDFDPGINSLGTLVPFSLVDLYNGGSTGDFYSQAFPSRSSLPIALYGIGFYAQDEWRMRPNLTVTLSLRVDHNSNPVCQVNCFATLTAPFTSLTKDPLGVVPYNQTIVTGRHQAYTDYNKLLWQPRVGFAWSPWSKTVLRGGIGYFNDYFPATIVDSFAGNPPFDPTFAVLFDNISPAEATNVFTDASSANGTFQTGFPAGLSAAQMIAANPLFTPPNVVVSDHTVKSPQYLEWNLAVQQEIMKNLAVTLNYVGNHGIREPIQNNGLNASFAGGWAGLPTSAPDGRFVNVNQVQSIGTSNYNGLSTSVQWRFTGGQLQFNYTWSHALDMISNGGFLPFNDSVNVSLANPQVPFNVAGFNYGNADYDVRHYLSMNYYWELPFNRLFHSTGAWQKVYRGWVISGTVFHRTGLPFTVVDSQATSLISGGYGGTVWAAQIAPGATTSCGSKAATLPTGFPSATPCLVASAFTGTNPLFPPVFAFGSQRRNQYRGPGFFDSDFTIVKNTKLTQHWESAELAVGFQFFNVLNHPNFDQPVNNTNDPLFGSVVRTVNTPTSILGSFLGGDASPRLIQLKIGLTF